jgi:hypothetical protein
MRLFDVILKLIKTLTLVNSDDYNQLYTDVKDWENTATETSDDKLKIMYAKIHKGVFARLMMPFAYFFLLKWVKDISNPEQSDVFLD